jgi:predicted small secreted protein
MLKKLILGMALAIALATVSVASILLDTGKSEQGVEVSGSVDTLDMMSQSRDLPEQTPANAI